MRWRNGGKTDGWMEMKERAGRTFERKTERREKDEGEKGDG